MVAKIAVILIGCVGVFFGRAYAVPAVVDYVFDGDTFAARVLVADGVGVDARVRLSDVDTPEIHGACEREIQMALRARDRMADLLPVGSVVELRNIKDDKYLGRIDADVYLSDGRNLSKILLDEKLGRPYDGGHRASWCE